MSDALDDWAEAKSRLDNARNALQQIAYTINAMATTLRSFACIEPGTPTTKVTPDYSNWPTVDAIAKAAEELNTAHLLELNAFSSLEPEEQVIASASRARRG